MHGSYRVHIMEFSDLGRSCAKCNYQDYLPFCCHGCKQWYCSDHRTYDAHSCKSRPTTNVPEHKPDPMVNTVTMYKCSYRNCREKSLFEFVCSECKKNHCINHRLHMVHAPHVPHVPHVPIDPVKPTITQKSIPAKQQAVSPPIPQTRATKPNKKQRSAKRDKKCVIL